MRPGPAPPPDGAPLPPGARRPLTRVAIDVPASAERLQDVHDALARFWVAVARLGGAPPGAWRAAFETAVAEVAANIVRHAYPDGTPRGTMRFRLCAFPDTIQARFADRGVDFRAPAADPDDPPELPPPPDDAPAGDDPDDPDDPLAFLDLAEGGYGLPLARAA